MTKAIAVFVKTPGRDAIKTRLAKDWGVERALGFYETCVTILSETLTNLHTQNPTWRPYFAITADDPRWNLPTISQGDGPLGTRLSRVYSNLRQSHSTVCLIGADSPQLRVEDFFAVENHLENHDFVFIPARDGGFALMAGRQPVSDNVWRQTPYSATNTLEVLISLLLATDAKVHCMPPIVDVDTIEDLALLKSELQNLSNLSAAQLSLQNQI